ncbi:glycoside hydrolase [Leifsonia sp. Root4]|uniref:glycoside hydrolase family 2 TIM barrel-domain containing protein n=1 Tax=Leifsonia sp. Root4 TaxID=1736525 RepID=UPI0006F70E44|nr:glycoside hydrolase family 2 TIM barrel-domain containing protein [Leifsonia sp. Root4]KQW05583.1 glycoside hydrolase [Leifsonia sp. Root4]
MTREIFNTGWRFRTKVTAFMELGGSSASEFTEVVLPHDALLEQPRSADVTRGETNGHFPSGAFEYVRTFSASEELRGNRVLLEFDGVYRDAAVFVNGNLAGQRAFGYSRFFVQIDPYLNFGGDNEIRVESRTHLDSRWYAGAGIYRDVHLVVKKPTHIATDGVVVTTPNIESDRATVEVAVEVENSGALTTTLRLDAAVLGAGGAVVASATSPVTLMPGTRVTVRHRLYVADPELWSVDAPTLYSLGLTLTDGDSVVDEQTVAFGIRSLQLDPQHGLRINGESVKLRGACIHSDNGPLGAVSMRAAEERRVGILKEAGFNAIRSAHNPMSTALLDACDRLGMLVMDETFDMWTSGKSDFDYAFDFPEWWERDVEAMVARDINHPSVIFYSIGNEIPETGSPIGTTWGRRLAEKVRSLDPNRYVTNGINGFVAMLDTIVPQMKARRDAVAAEPAGGVNTMMAGFGQMMSHIQTSQPATERTEESYAVLDVAGMNYADARYELDRELFPDRIIVGTETWPTSIVGNWALVEENGHVIGDFTWTGWDYLGETGIGSTRYVDQALGGASSFSGGFPELTAWCGDIDIIGHRRPVSYFREIVFGLRSEPYIAVNPPANFGRAIAVSTPWAWGDAIESWSWQGFEGQPVTVDVYSDAEQVELQLDGVSLGRAVVEDFRVAFDTVYAPGELTAVSYVADVETGRFSIRSAAACLALQAIATRTELRLDGTDLGFVELCLSDGSGIVRNDVDRPITVTLEGPATLAALGSGNPVTTEIFTAAEHSTFNGRALAVVRPTGAGEITVTAVAEGCQPAVTTLSAR